MGDNNSETDRSISQKWVEDVYNSLKNLEIVERLAMNGCENILDYVESELYTDPIGSEKTINMIRAKNIILWIKESKILLRKLKNFIESEEYRKLNNRIDYIDSIVGSPEDLLNVEYNQSMNGRQINKININDLGKVLQENLEYIREEIESKCWPLLKPTIDENKSKKRGL